jgi:TRAP-type C4-dicarboxylate transport system permease small subunit
VRNRIEKAVGGVLSINKAAHYTSGAVMLVMLGITVLNILGRWLLQSPVGGTVETIPLLLVIVVFLGFPYAQHCGDHIAVDLLYSRLPKGVQNRLSVGNHIFSLLVLAFVTIQLWKYAGIQYQGGYATAVIGWPIHWFVRIAALGSALLWVATAAETVADLIGLERESSDEASSVLGGLAEQGQIRGDR